MAFVRKVGLDVDVLTHSWDSQKLTRIREAGFDFHIAKAKAVSEALQLEENVQALERRCCRATG